MTPAETLIEAVRLLELAECLLETIKLDEDADAVFQARLSCQRELKSMEGDK